MVSIDSNLMLELRKTIFSNAKRLLFDAEILFDARAFPSSAFLAISSIEETGKLYDALSAYYESKNGKLDINKFLRRFKSHSLKQLSSFIKILSKIKNGQKIPKYISKVWELSVTKVVDSKDTELMAIRNNCIYTDIDLKKSLILNPQNKIRRENAYYYIEIAYEVLLSQIESAFGDCRIDERQDIDIEKIQKERELLVERLKLFREKGL